MEYRAGAGALNPPHATHEAIDKERRAPTVADEEGRAVFAGDDAATIGMGEEQVIEVWEEAHRGGRIRWGARSVRQIEKLAALLVAECEQFGAQHVNGLLEV